MTGGYEVGRVGGRCAATGEPLTPGSPIVAALVDRPGEDDLTRIDTNAAAWDAGFRPPGLFAFWRTIVPSPDAKPRTVIDDDALLDLFQSLDPGDAAPAHDRRTVFRYILALLLVRRKRLLVAPDPASRSGAEGVMRLRHRGADGPTVEVAIPALDAEAMGAATEQLSELIGTGA